MAHLEPQPQLAVEDGTVLGRQIALRRRPGTGRPRRERRIVGLGLLAAATVGFLVVSGIYFVWPSSQPLRKADAILALNGADDGARTDLAVSLLRRGYAPVLLFSEGSGGNDCPHEPGLRIICFDPRPARTVGELDEAQSYARTNHLRSLLIVSGRAQTTRARLIAHRCFTGPVTVVSPPTPWVEIPLQVVYEWGATAKALLVATGCS